MTFHDGTPLTAADVVASMNRHLDPRSARPGTRVYQNVTSIEQTGDREVTVTEASADSQFNLAMGGSAGVIESAATLAEAGADYGNSTGGVNCTGPFSLDEWKSGERITLTRYDDYWDESLRRQVGRGRVRLHERRQRPGQRARSRARSTAAGWSRSEAIPQLENSSVGDMLLRHEHGGRRASSSATSTARSATRTCARRCSWRSTARASSRPRPRATAR